MSLLLTAAPTLCADLCGALAKQDQADLADRIRDSEILSWSYSDDDGIGYVYLKRPVYPIDGVHNEAAPVAYTISFPGSYEFGVNIDHEGNAFGIEIMGRSEIFDEIREYGAR